MSIWSIIPLLSFLTYVVLVILVLQQARRRVDKVFALFLSAAGVWSFTSFMLHLNASPQLAVLWNQLVIIALSWVTICYYHFVRAYNNRPGGIGLYLGYAYVLVILFFSFSGYVVQSAYVTNGILHHDLGIWLYIIGSIIFVFLASAMFMLIQRYRSSINPTDRNRTMYLITGSGIVMVVSYVNNLMPSIAGLPLDHLGNLTNALIIAYAISRYQLLDIRFVVRRGLAYSLLITLLVGVYIGSIFLVQELLPTLPTYSIILFATVIVILLALLARPLRYAIQERIDRLFYRGTYDYRQALLHFSSKMGNIINLKDLSTEMLTTINKALHLTQSRLLFQDIDGDDFTTQFVYPETKDELDNKLRLNTDNPIVAWLVDKGNPLDLKQLDSIPEFKGLWKVEKEQLTTPNLEFLCPIKSRDKLIGILALGKKRTGSLYSHEDLELVMSIANQAGIMIENAQLYNHATIRANTDGLTELYNHRHFYERLDQEIARGSRFGAIFSIIMLDIDLFKTYNDIYGHVAGDQVLRKIGSHIKSSIRNLDMPFRYGGEEFAVILPEARLDDAYKVAERIRRTIESKMGSQAMSVTASLGVASWPSDGVLREEIIANADAALYRAKQTGRNRTCLASDVTKAEVSQVGAALEARRGALSIIYALAATIDAKDHYTYGHSKKVSNHAVALAEVLGLPKDRIYTIQAAALLHDIGKIGVPDSILNKEGTLTKKEWEPVRAHPELGVEILRHVVDLINCLPAILHHHEHYDGKGYPSGLAGENIPLEARILSIADAYDAITSMRPYHEQLSSQQALDELKHHAGTQFDPGLVDAFYKILEPTLAKEIKIK